MSPSDPRILKFLKSTKAAFPLGRDPWADLAHGLFATETEVRTWVEELNLAGALLGTSAEPNVHHPTIRESLHIGPAIDARWTANTADGIIASHWSSGTVADSGWQAEQWFKMGLSLDLRVPGEQSDPFAASSDRSLMPESPAEWPSAELGADGELRALSRPIPLDPQTEFWPNLAAATKLPDPRASIPRVVLSRLARRFALRLSPTALGWHGCGLACWKLDEKDAPRAAWRPCRHYLHG
jgi:hypothetical protein